MIEASQFYREIRQLALTAPVWDSVIRYFVKPDERWDLTLVSQRVYGNREDYLTIMAAAGLDRLDQPLLEQELILPTPDRLAAIKRRTGYQTVAPRGRR